MKVKIEIEAEYFGDETPDLVDFQPIVIKSMYDEFFDMYAEKVKIVGRDDKS